MRACGRLDDAVAGYHRTLQLQPELAEAYNNLGNILLDLMQLEEAAASYRLALALRPDYAHAHTGRACGV